MQEKLVPLADSNKSLADTLLKEAQVNKIWNETKQGRAGIRWTKSLVPKLAQIQKSPKRDSRSISITNI